MHIATNIQATSCLYTMVDRRDDNQIGPAIQGDSDMPDVDDEDVEALIKTLPEICEGLANGLGASRHGGETLCNSSIHPHFVLSTITNKLKSWLHYDAAR